MEFNYEQIEKYIKGELSPIELQSFEQELAGNSSLKDEVALYKDVNKTLSTHFKYEEEDNAMKTTLDQLGKKYASGYKDANEGSSILEKEQAAGNEKTIIRRLLPLATLAAAASVLFFLFNPFQGSTFDAFYKPYKASFSQVRGDDSSKDLANAEKAYGSKDFETVVELTAKYPDDINAQMAKGGAEMELKNYAAAIATFKKIASKPSTYQNTANWYLALAYVKQNETEKAKTVLQQVPSGSNYFDKAQQLLKKL